MLPQLLINKTREHFKAVTYVIRFLDFGCPDFELGKNLRLQNLKNRDGCRLKNVTNPKSKIRTLSF